jgi:carboxylesterase type B
MERVNRDWEKMASFVLRYDEFIPKEMWKDVAKKIREFYLGKNHNFTTENYDKLVQIITDGHFVAGVVKSIQLQATVTNASVYYYRLSYTGDSKKRVEHADDIQYFFYDREGRQPTQNELKMKDIMVHMWVSYAKTRWAQFLLGKTLL